MHRALEVWSTLYPTKPFDVQNLGYYFLFHGSNVVRQTWTETEGELANVIYKEIKWQNGKCAKRFVW